MYKNYVAPTQHCQELTVIDVISFTNDVVDSSSTTLRVFSRFYVHSVRRSNTPAECVIIMSFMIQA